jgi:hypothetical protein
MLVKLGSLKNSILVFLVKSALGFSSCGGIVLLLPSGDLEARGHACYAD